MSLSEQLLEEALLLGLVVLGALGSGALLGGCSSDGALVQVGITANKVHCALDVRKYLDLLHLQKHGNKVRGNAYRGKEVARTITDSVGKSLKAVNHFDRFEQQCLMQGLFCCLFTTLHCLLCDLLRLQGVFFVILKKIKRWFVT